MNTVEMRKALKEKGLNVPRSNESMIELYNETFKTADEPEKVFETAEVVSNVTKIDELWTYVGSGVEPPHKIKFMNIQWFTRGIAEKVTDPLLLSKLNNNSSFVKGKVDDMSVYYEQEKAEADRVQKVKDEEVKIQIAMDRQNRG